MTQQEALWYKDAVIYEVHVRAFSDSDGDGIGDFKGLLGKLDYLQDLGVTAIWLLPFYPSPLRDDGYDISDYMHTNDAYGTLRDFKAFLREARRQGLRVITELVLNHTSDEHPWFQRSRNAPAGSPERDFYVWSDTPERYRDARIIFKDFEHSNWSWDPVARVYYWHRFYSHQPDLNWASPRVRQAMYNVVDFWLEMGVDGLRLDAVPYLFEKEGTNCENLPETHQALTDLRRHIDDRYPNRMLLAEANQWPDDAIAYFGKGDECHMAFHFPLMPRMFMALRTEDRFPIIDILSQTPPIPDSCQWALFLRNHDELTLEMVTDEDRDYMYRVYAQDPQARINLGIRRRLAPLLQNNRRMIEMMNVLLFSLPGTPVIYYGDEIGMGDNIYLGDRKGVRTPMQWSPGRNAGFSPANPQRLYLPVIIDPEYHAEAVNVEAQLGNPHSLLWWMKRLVALRRQHLAFSRGTLEFLYPENGKVLAFMRHYEDEHILVVANLSRLAQHVELDLSEWQGRQLIELFGGTEFPAVGERPYFFTLGPHAFYWFSLTSPRVEALVAGAPRKLPTLKVTRSWEEIFTKLPRRSLEDALPGYLRAQRWFGGKARRIRGVQITEAVAVGEIAENGHKRAAGYLAFLLVEYVEGDPETYILPMACAVARRANEVEALGDAAIAWVDTGHGRLLLFDAMHDDKFCTAILDAIAKRSRLSAGSAKLIAMPTRAFKRLRGDGGALQPSVMQSEQSNTSVNFGDRLLFKLFRRPGPGLNPDLELGRFLTDEAGFQHVAPVAGALELMKASVDPVTVGILHGFIPNQGDCWTYTVDGLGRFVERVISQQLLESEPPAPPGGGILDAAEIEPPAMAGELIGLHLDAARLIGQRTAELHLAFCSKTDNPAFAPEPFTPFYQRSLYESMRTQTSKVFRLLAGQRKRTPEVVQVIDLEEEIVKRFRRVVGLKLEASRIRCHGDYHLGQVLNTGKDFLIIDLEGEPGRSLSERRIKRSPFLDVAGMVRSFHYAAFSLLKDRAGGVASHHEPWVLEPWLDFWYRWVSAQFLRRYLEVAGDAGFVPSTRLELSTLLDAFLLDKAVYELGYEANNRPDWIKIPIRGVLDLVQT